MKELTERQRRFIDFYIQCPNATNAAIQAGYSAKSAKVTASKLLTFSNVSREIEKRLDEIRDEQTATTKEVLRFLTSLMRGQLTEKICLPVHGQKSRVEVVELPPKTRDRLKAAELLAKIFGAFRAKDEESEVPTAIKIIRAGE